MPSTDQERIVALEARLAEVERRLAVLEHGKPYRMPAKLHCLDPFEVHPAVRPATQETKITCNG